MLGLGCDCGVICCAKGTGLDKAPDPPSLPPSLIRFGHVFLWDSGSSVGDIIGHSKAINAIDLKQTRPFRVVTAGEDNLMCWYEGPPFRFKRDIKEHTRFVNAIRFSPNGERACSGSADGTVGGCDRHLLLVCVTRLCHVTCHCW